MVFFVVASRNLRHVVKTRRHVVNVFLTNENLATLRHKMYEMGSYWLRYMYLERLINIYRRCERLKYYITYLTFAN